ncbi:5398_t:CDS:2, partial [Entrophospora sp. SA101]
MSRSPTNSLSDQTNSIKSNASSTSGGDNSITIKNYKCPDSKDYLRRHKSVTFSYLSDPNNSSSFQLGNLNDSDTFIVGVLHLKYSKPTHIKNVCLSLKGVEKTSWHKAQARTKVVYGGEHVLVDQTNKIKEFGDGQEVEELEIPFKIQLPYNLPETIVTETGSITYVLRATVNFKSLLHPPNVTKIKCPLKRVIEIDHQNLPPYKLSGNSSKFNSVSGINSRNNNNDDAIEYVIMLPPNKNLSLGSRITIPMMLRLLRQGISVDRVEISLKTCMDFQSNNHDVTKHEEINYPDIKIQQSELQFSQPVIINNVNNGMAQYQHYGECHHNFNLFIPTKIQPTYQGRYIGISHQLYIKISLWGFEKDIDIEESVRIANIIDKNFNDSPSPKNVINDRSSSLSMNSTPARPSSPSSPPPPHPNSQTPFRIPSVSPTSSLPPTNSLPPEHLINQQHLLQKILSDPYLMSAIYANNNNPGFLPNQYFPQFPLHPHHYNLLPNQIPPQLIPPHLNHPHNSLQFHPSLNNSGSNNLQPLHDYHQQQLNLQRQLEQLDPNNIGVFDQATNAAAGQPLLYRRQSQVSIENYLRSITCDVFGSGVGDVPSDQNQKRFSDPIPQTSSINCNNNTANATSEKNSPSVNVSSHCKLTPSASPTNENFLETQDKNRSSLLSNANSVCESIKTLSISDNDKSKGEKADDNGNNGHELNDTLSNVTIITARYTPSPYPTSLSLPPYRHANTATLTT